jgi:hypothetical protein
LDLGHTKYKESREHRILHYEEIHVEIVNKIKEFMVGEARNI